MSQEVESALQVWNPEFNPVIHNVLMMDYEAKIEIEVGSFKNF
jgi:hypothetical protein